MSTDPLFVGFDAIDFRQSAVFSVFLWWAIVINSPQRHKEHRVYTEKT
jgi:hypothetical protein